MCVRYPTTGVGRSTDHNTIVVIVIRDCGPDLIYGITPQSIAGIKGFPGIDLDRRYQQYIYIYIYNIYIHYRYRHAASIKIFKY
jgi:hypothetical protein